MGDPIEEVLLEVIHGKLHEVLWAIDTFGSFQQLRKIEHLLPYTVQLYLLQNAMSRL